MMRKYAISQILEHLSANGITSSFELLEAIDGLNISTSTFFRALKELEMSGTILRYESKLKSGKRRIAYRINIHAISSDQR